MIEPILKNHSNLKNLFYQKLDKVREEFDFNNPSASYQKVIEIGESLKEELIKHFELQLLLKGKVNSGVDSIILENMLVKEILVRMITKIIEGAKSENIDIFPYFDEFEEIFRAYLLKEKGLFIEKLKTSTSKEEQKFIEEFYLSTFP